MLPTIYDLAGVPSREPVATMTCPLRGAVRLFTPHRRPENMRRRLPTSAKGDDIAPWETAVAAAAVVLRAAPTELPYGWGTEVEFEVVRRGRTAETVRAKFHFDGVWEILRISPAGDCQLSQAAHDSAVSRHLFTLATTRHRRVAIDPTVAREKSGAGLPHRNRKWL